MTTATFADVATLSDYEIERGKPMPDLKHAITQTNLGFHLMLKYRQRYRILTEINVDFPIKERVPDVAIYPPLEFDRDDNPIRMTEMPLGAIEILSEMQSPHELMKKRMEYFMAGVKSYWIVLPALKTIYVFRSPEDYDIFGYRDVLIDESLGIELSLKDIFS